MLAEEARAPQALVVCGRDDGLVRRVRNATAAACDRFKVFGYVDDADGVVEHLTALAGRTRDARGAVQRPAMKRTAQRP
ncbi:MAG TPA: hypothetical protein VKW09_00265 [bacterium]|nr:hypothetical protein [bacterium]